MGLADVLGCEDRIQIKVGDLMQILRSDALNWAQNQVMVKGLEAHLPHNHILIMAGEEPTQIEPSVTAEEIPFEPLNKEIIDDSDQMY